MFQVKGMLAQSASVNESEAQKALIDRFERDFARACKSGKDEEVRQAVLMFTALFVSLRGYFIFYIQKLEEITESRIYSDYHPTRWCSIKKNSCH